MERQVGGHLSSLLQDNGGGAAPPLLSRRLLVLRRPCCFGDGLGLALQDVVRCTRDVLAGIRLAGRTQMQEAIQP